MFLSPPYWDVYSPFSAVPCLVGKLMQEGYKCCQYDIGILCIHTLLENNWDQGLKHISSQNFYEKHIKYYRKNCYKNYEDYLSGISFMSEGYKMISKIKNNYINYNAVQKRVLDAFYNYIYSTDTLDIDFDNCENIEQLIRLSDIENLVRTLKKESLSEIFENIPSVVGISITSTYQFVPGCVIAKVIKHCFPNVKIIMGGSCADLFVKSLYGPKKDINKYFDYIIVGEGETAIVQLMKCFEGKIEIDTVPNILSGDMDGQPVVTKQIIEDVNLLPTPCYDGLDLELYLAPRLIIPYQTSRGCHYGYCAFCNHDEKYRHNYRAKDIKNVIGDLLSLSKKYNTNYFQFVDEAIRPDCFEMMVEEMDKYPEFKKMKWIYYSRVSRQYKKETLEKARNNGCEMVMFGVETLNQRLLKFIKKGILAETSKYCLKLFHDAGIKTYAWLMCNLPSETVEEAKQDLRDVMELEKYIDAFYVGPFALSKNTDMYENLEKYNITKVCEKNALRFESHNDGQIIDKDEMLKFYRCNYAKYQLEYCSTANRYTVFFE